MKEVEEAPHSEIEAAAGHVDDAHDAARLHPLGLACGELGESDEGADRELRAAHGGGAQRLTQGELDEVRSRADADAALPSVVLRCDLDAQGLASATHHELAALAWPIVHPGSELFPSLNGHAVDGEHGILRL